MKQLISIALFFCAVIPIRCFAITNNDPEGTVIVRLSNDVDKDNSFSVDDFPNHPISMTPTNNLIPKFGNWEFAVFGKVNGIGYMQGIPETGWTSKVALAPKTGYVCRLQKGFWDNGAPYYVYMAIYCDSWILRVGDMGIIGAVLKYIYPFSPKVKALNSFVIENSSVPSPQIATWLLEEADTNRDGRIDRNERIAVTELGRKAYGAGKIDISNGIENLYDFPNLNELWLDESHFKLGRGLKISHSNLKKIIISWAKVDNLDFSECTSLQSIFIDHCDIKSIKLPKSIEDIDVANNCLQDIGNLCNLKKLRRLVAYNNNISSLNVSCLPNLEILSIGNNGLAALDVSKNLKLKSLYCYGNKIQQLDISDNPDIEILSVAEPGKDNSIKKLFIPAGKTKRDYKGSTSGKLSWFAGIEIINR